eukprot:4901096-Alexandrium_andersonii.AAC.1
MSASLVGSEMCIRDRTNETRVVSRSALGAAHRPFGQKTAARAAQRSPVSYTHLTLPTICSV